MKCICLIKYIKNVLWTVAKHLSYIEDSRCLKVNQKIIILLFITLPQLVSTQLRHLLGAGSQSLLSDLSNYLNLTL